MSETNLARLYTLALLAVLIYGATPVVTKIATMTADGVTVGALRAVVAAPLAGLVILAGGHRIPLDARSLSLVVVSGVGGLVLFPVFFSWGVQLTTAGHAAAGTAFGAVMAGVLAAAIDRRLPGWRWWIGIATGTAGALLLIWEAVGIEVTGVSWQGDALVFLGMFMGVVGYVAGARLTREIGSVTVTMWSVLVAAALLLPLVVFHSGMETLRGIDAHGWMAILSLGWGTTILAYLFWNRALADGGVARIGALQLLQPVIGIGLAPVLLGEPLTGILVIATGIILAGVVLVQRERRV
ncbi:MAG: DMT family transporter [Alphaproteobacteria bacterium]|nr:DMT family transporter [Alphaproteobacteria bacterium]